MMKDRFRGWNHQELPRCLCGAFLDSDTIREGEYLLKWTCANCGPQAVYLGSDAETEATG